MNRLLLFTTILLSFTFLTCSVGTDPGECEEIECLPVVYDLSINDWRWTIGDSASPSYFIYAKINPETDINDLSRHITYTVRFNESRRAIQGGNWNNGGAYFSLETERDTFTVAPAGAYNVWRISKNFTSVVFDSIQIPADPVRLSSHYYLDRFDPTQDLVLEFSGDLEKITYGTLSLEIIADEDLFQLESRPLSRRVIIPAAEFQDIADQKLRLQISLFQMYGKEYLNQYDEHINLVYSKRETIYLYSQP